MGLLALGVALAQMAVTSFRDGQVQVELFGPRGDDAAEGEEEEEDEDEDDEEEGEDEDEEDAS